MTWMKGPLPVCNVGWLSKPFRSIPCKPHLLLGGKGGVRRSDFPHGQQPKPSFHEERNRADDTPERDYQNMVTFQVKGAQKQILPHLGTHFILNFWGRGRS
ncbi:unnamed protein product [Ectocarpus sp. 12 AP-2014]